MSKDFATDYIDVAARLAEFRSKYPDGSLQPADLAVPYRIENIEGVTYLSVVAAAYRTPDDVRPGIGMAYELVPGKTPYTRGSELQNAETSAWGRAIVAALAADTKKGVASANEVRNAQANQVDDGVRALKQLINAEREKLGWSIDRITTDFQHNVETPIGKATAEQLRSYLGYLRQPVSA